MPLKKYDRKIKTITIQIPYGNTNNYVHKKNLATVKKKVWTPLDIVFNINLIIISFIQKEDSRNFYNSHNTNIDIKKK